MKFIFTLLLLGVAVLGFGQQGTFKVSAFAPEYGYSNQLVQLNDGSFVSVGENFYSDYEDTGFLMKTDAKGNVLAYKTLPSTAAAYSVVKTNDGGFAVCGVLSGVVQLIKFKADLTIQWEKDYSTDGSARINKMIQAPDSSFLLVGTYFNSESNLTGYAMKTDAVGTLQFAKTYLGYASADETDVDLVDVAATTDGNYAFAAQAGHYSNEEIPDSAYIIKVNAAGTVLWVQAAYSNTANQSVDAYRMIATSDGGLLLTGDLYTPATFTLQMAMAKYNNAGSLLWSKSMVANNPGTTDSYGDGVIEDKDGGYLFYGALDVYSNNDDTEYAYIAKTDAAGALQWTKKYYPLSGSYYPEFYDMIRTSDGGYAACGDGDFFYPDQNDYYESGFVFKIDQNFKTCNDSIVSEGTLKNSIASVSKTAVIEDISTVATDVSASLHEGGETNLLCSTSGTLPLQILSFNATLQNKSIAVQWKTADEINTNYFIVERSPNATTFTALQQVAAKGNSTGVQTYNTSDLQPLPGTSYYRLKEVDNDGKITYSSVVPVTVLNNGVIIISPNPVGNAVRVIMQSEGSANVSFQVVDIRGRILTTQKASVVAGRNEITIPASSLAKGVYMLKVIENNTAQTIRFVKE